MINRINCICVDREKKSREAVEGMLKKISNMHISRSYATLETATNACLENNIDLLFIHLYDSPVPDKEAAFLEKIMKYGTKIILMSSRIGVASDAAAINASDYVLFPTSSRRLWKASMKALKIKDFGIEVPKMKLVVPDQVEVSLFNYY